MKRSICGFFEEVLDSFYSDICSFGFVDPPCRVKSRALHNIYNLKLQCGTSSWTQAITKNVVEELLGDWSIKSISQTDGSQLT